MARESVKVRPARRVQDDRFTGYGMIDPGAGANRMLETMMTKVERRYVMNRGRQASAYEAVRKARAANKQPPLG